MAKEKEDITAKTKLKDIIDDEKSVEILLKHGVPCIHCPMFKQEMEKLTLGGVCETYGLDLEAILKDLNKNL